MIEVILKGYYSKLRIIDLEGKVYYLIDKGLNIYHEDNSGNSFFNILEDFELIHFSEENWDNIYKYYIEKYRNNLKLCCKNTTILKSTFSWFFV